MNEQLFLSEQDKEQLSFFYDRNWEPFRQFIRKRFRLSSFLLRKIYEESFGRLAEQIREGNAITVPLKIALYRIASEKVQHLPATKRKELPDVSAFQAEWQAQERYIQIYQVVKVWLDEEKEAYSDEEKYVCIRKVAEMEAIEWPASVPHDEEIKRQKEIECYLFGEMKSRERFELEKVLHEDKVSRWSQYEAITLFTDTANNVADDEELKEIIESWKAEAVQSLLREKRTNRRFLWQAGLVALILFLLNLLMRAFY